VKCPFIAFRGFFTLVNRQHCFTTMTNNIMLIGVPVSGKSTLCAALAAQGYFIVSTDAARAVLAGDAAVQHPWPEVWAACQELAQKAVAAGQPIVYDATNVVLEHRQLPLTLAEGPWEAWVLTTPLEECLRRNAARERVVPEEVILGMHKAYTPPTLEEGFVLIRQVD
jgi:predicted kinase